MIDIIKAILQIFLLFFKKGNVADTKREVLSNELDKAIATGDTRALHRLLSRL